MLIILSILIIGLLGLLVVFIWRKSHRCRYCQCVTVKLMGLPEDDRELAVGVITQEGLGNFDLSTYDICPECRRIYDWRWFDDDRPFRRDWDMHDRQCRCGSDLRRPLSAYFSDEKLREAIAQIRPDAVGRMRLAFSPEHIAAIHTDITLEDHIFFICIRCRRIYMWLPAGTFQVFQCVTRGNTPYDEGPTGQEVFFDRGF